MREHSDDAEIQTDEATARALTELLGLLPADVVKDLNDGEIDVNDPDFLRAVMDHVMRQQVAAPSVSRQIGGKMKIVQKQLQAILRERHPEAARRQTVRRESSSRVGRNDACPCGSGRKFKKCCMHKQR